MTPSDDPIHLTWKGMEDVSLQGLAKAIGVSNFSGGLLIDLFRSAKIKVRRGWPCRRRSRLLMLAMPQPAILQIEHHPYHTQEGLLALCKHFGVAVTAYSSFGPASWIELGLATEIPSLLEHPLVKSIAAKHGKTSAQVLLRWATQRGVACIPKSSNAVRSRENLESLSFDLGEDDIKGISALNEDRRIADPAAIHPALAIYA